MTHGNSHRSTRGRMLGLALGSVLSTTATADFLPGFNILQLEDLNFNLSEVHDINNLGETGGSSVAGGAFEAEARPVFWDAAGNATQLEFSSNPTSTNQKIISINDSGNMLGLHESLGCAVWIDLVPGSLDSGCGVEINNTNQIVGSSGSSSINSLRATIWNDLTPSLLGSEPEGYYSTASALNNLGQVVGKFTQSYNLPVIWFDNQATYLGTLPGFEPDAIPVSINDHAQIVGYSGVEWLNRYRAVVWENGSIADLGTLGGESAKAIDINNAGQIIGVSQAASGQSRPFLWQNGVMYDLAPALCADPTACRVSVSAINDLGQIAYTEKVASAYSSVDYTYAYRLSIADGALESLPSVSAPLNFVTPDGAGPVGDTPPQIGNADLQVSITTDQKSIAKGELLQYKIAVNNKGSTDARDIVLTTEPVTGTVRTLISQSDVEVCNYSYSTMPTVICNFGLLAGTSRTIILTVEHIRGNKITRSATVESATFDPDLQNNSATAETRVLNGKRN